MSALMNTKTAIVLAALLATVPYGTAQQGNDSRITGYRLGYMDSQATIPWGFYAPSKPEIKPALRLLREGKAERASQLLKPYCLQHPNDKVALAAWVACEYERNRAGALLVQLDHKVPGSMFQQILEFVAARHLRNKKGGLTQHQIDLYGLDGMKELPKNAPEVDSEANAFLNCDTLAAWQDWFVMRKWAMQYLKKFPHSAGLSLLAARGFAHGRGPVYWIGNKEYPTPKEEQEEHVELVGKLLDDVIQRHPTITAAVFQRARLGIPLARTRRMELLKRYLEVEKEDTERRREAKRALDYWIAHPEKP